MTLSIVVTHSEGETETMRHASMSEQETLTVCVTNIPTEGLSVDCEVDAERIELAPTDGEARGQLMVHVDIVPADKDLSVSGILSGTFIRQCVRCLRDFEDFCKVPFRVDYKIKKQEAPRRIRRSAPPDQEASDDIRVLTEGESYSYSGDELNLGPMLREQVILASPMQPLCRRDCRGLCPVCGEDRNLVACGCAEARPANPFSVLRDLWPKDGNSSGKQS